jgi:hypothetical protein
MGFEDNIWVSCNVDPGSKSIVSAHHGNAANFAEMIQANYEEWFAYAGELPPGSIIPLIGGTFGGTPGNPPIPKIPEELVREIVQQAGAMSGMSQFGTTAIQNEIK